MDRQLDRDLRKLEKTLWREFRAVLDIPEAVPPAMRLQILRETCEDLRGDPEFKEIQALFPGESTTVGYCTGWCPECLILEWCDFAREQFTPEDTAWMAAHKCYPPDFEFKI